MELIRIGDKVVDRDKIYRTIDRLLVLRGSGLSQAEAAAAVGIDRSFVSRVESLGEVRKGARVALVGFPVANKDELEAAAKDAGVDLVWLMNDAERWSFIESRSGIELLNDVMRAMYELKEFDCVVFLGSDMRVKLVEAILGSKAYGVVIGESPIKHDVIVDAGAISRLVEGIRGDR